MVSTATAPDRTESVNTASMDSDASNGGVNDALTDALTRLAQVSIKKRRDPNNPFVDARGRPVGRGKSSEQQANHHIDHHVDRFEPVDDTGAVDAPVDLDAQRSCAQLLIAKNRLANRKRAEQSSEAQDKTSAGEVAQTPEQIPALEKEPTPVQSFPPPKVPRTLDEMARAIEGLWALSERPPSAAKPAGAASSQTAHGAGMLPHGLVASAFEHWRIGGRSEQVPPGSQYPDDLWAIFDRAQGQITLEIHGLCAGEPDPDLDIRKHPDWLVNTRSSPVPTRALMINVDRSEVSRHLPWAHEVSRMVLIPRTAVKKSVQAVRSSSNQPPKMEMRVVPDFGPVANIAPDLQSGTILGFCTLSAPASAYGAHKESMNQFWVVIPLEQARKVAHSESSPSGYLNALDCRISQQGKREERDLGCWISPVAGALLTRLNSITPEARDIAPPSDVWKTEQDVQELRELYEPGRAQCEPQPEKSRQR